MVTKRLRLSCILLTGSLLLLVAGCLMGQVASNVPSTTDQTNAPTNPGPIWKFTTPAYKTEVVRLLIKEANHVARQLNLSEQLPITTSNIVEVFVPPPAMRMLGTISTSNYVYYFVANRQFSGVDVQKHDGNWQKVTSDFKNWPISRLDTNGAFKTGLEIMRSASADVAGLEKDCTVEIVPVLTEGPKGKHFIPDYWINWKKDGRLVAFIEFLEPSKSIRQLHVYDPKYMLSSPVEIPNLADLLKEGNAPKELLRKMGLEETNTPAGTSAPATTNAPAKPQAR